MESFDLHEEEPDFFKLDTDMKIGNMTMIQLGPNRNFTK